MKLKCKITKKIRMVNNERVKFVRIIVKIAYRRAAHSY